MHAVSLRNDPAMKKELVPMLDDDNGAVRLRAAAGYLRLSAIEAGARAKKRSTAAPAACAGAEEIVRPPQLYRKPNATGINVVGTYVLNT